MEFNVNASWIIYKQKAATLQECREFKCPFEKRTTWPLFTKVVYWQESGDKMCITMQGLSFSILWYCKQGDIVSQACVL